MTQEEYEQEQREIERLVNEINRLIAENNALVQEINSAISDIRVLRSNVATLHRNVEPVMTGVSGEVNVQSEKIHRIFEALEELTAQYATLRRCLPRRKTCPNTRMNTTRDFPIITT